MGTFATIAAFIQALPQIVQLMNSLTTMAQNGIQIAQTASDLAAIQAKIKELDAAITAAKQNHDNTGLNNLFNNHGSTT